MSYASTGGDGNVSNNHNDLNWDTLHNDTDGTSATYGGGSWSIYAVARHTGSEYRLARAFIPFDTSGIPDIAVITAADVNLYVNVAVGGDDDEMKLVGETTQANESQLSTADFDQCDDTHSPQFCSAAVTITNLTINQFNSIDLDSTGLSIISKTGNTLLGIRVSGDYNDSAPSSGAQDNFQAEGSGGSNVPYLDVTYTVPVQINMADVWKEISTLWINIADIWKAIAAMKINYGDSWKDIF